MVLAVPLPAADVESPGPMAIKKWSIRWDRFKRKVIIDATFSNTSVKRVSRLSVVLEFFSDKGKLAKRSSPWRKYGVGGKAATRMNLRTYCPPFSRYRVKVTGTAKEPFEQLFEGKYWPDKPGDTPDIPQPVVYAKGTADVRVMGSRAEYRKVSKRREAMRISGMVQNMGDKPAKNVVVTITMIAKEKAVWTKDIAVKSTKLEPGATAPFSVIVKRLPHHTSITYHVDFDDPTKTTEEALTIEKFDVEAGPLIIKDCFIDPKTGLFTGTLINKSRETVTDTVVNISIEKAGVTTTYKIKPGGPIKPGDNLPLIKATMPGLDSFGVNV